MTFRDTGPSFGRWGLRSLQGVCVRWRIRGIATRMRLRPPFFSQDPDLMYWMYTYLKPFYIKIHSILYIKMDSNPLPAII